MNQIKEKQNPQQQISNIQQIINSDYHQKKQISFVNNISTNSQQSQNPNINCNQMANNFQQKNQTKQFMSNINPIDQQQQKCQQPFQPIYVNSIKNDNLLSQDGNQQAQLFSTNNKTSLIQTTFQVEKNVNQRLSETLEDQKIKNKQVNDLLQLKEKMRMRIQERIDSQKKEADQINSSFND